mgnify:CR=1 FL=1
MNTTAEKEYKLKVREVLNALLKGLEALGKPIERGILLPYEVIKKRKEDVLKDFTPEEREKARKEMNNLPEETKEEIQQKENATLNKMYKELKEKFSFIFRNRRPHPSFYEAQDEILKAIEGLNYYCHKHNLPVRSFVSSRGPVLTLEDLLDWCNWMATEWGHPPPERFKQLNKLEPNEVYNQTGLWAPSVYKRLKAHITTELNRQFFKIKTDIGSSSTPWWKKVEEFFIRNWKWLIVAIIVPIVAPIITWIVIKNLGN